MNGAPAEASSPSRMTLDGIAGEVEAVRDRISSISGRLIGTMGRLYGALPDSSGDKERINPSGLINAISNNLAESRVLLASIENSLEELEAATQ